MKTRNKFGHMLALALVAGFVLSACGIRGELKTPPPLWGEQSEKPVEKQDEKLESNT